MRKNIALLVLLVLAAVFVAAMTFKWVDKYNEVYTEERAATGFCSCDNAHGLIITIPEGVEVTIYVPDGNTPKVYPSKTDATDIYRNEVEACVNNRAISAAWGTVFDTIFKPPPGLPVNPSSQIVGTAIGIAYGRWLFRRTREEYDQE